MAVLAPDDRGAHSAVVLVNGTGGSELCAVQEMLTGVLGIPSILLTIDDLVAPSLCWDLDSGVLQVGARRVRPAVVWTRHCAPDTLVAQARRAVQVNGTSTRRTVAGGLSSLAAASWSGLLTALTDAAGIALPGTAPAGTAQIHHARRLGIRTPRTAYTTDVAAGARQTGSRRVVVKTPDFRLVEPDPRRWGPCLPVVLDAGALPADRVAPGRPVVVQEYVEHIAELRVFYLNSTLFAFRVDKPEPATMWTDPAGVVVTPVDCPPAAATAVRALASGWGLRYAAFDLLLTPAAKVVFLEANPDGDWLFFERKARWHGVSLPVALMVRELFREVTSKGVVGNERAAT